MISRRGFLGMFGAGVAAAATNPVHFFAPVGGWNFGLRYWHVEGNSGSWLGLERSAYPGRLN